MFNSVMTISSLVAAVAIGSFTAGQMLGYFQGLRDYPGFREAIREGLEQGLQNYRNESEKKEDNR